MQGPGQHRIATIGAMAQHVGRPGRPPDASINERSLQAARELLVEHGFEATTIRLL